MDLNPENEPAWAKYQAAKSPAAREKRDAFLRTLDAKCPSSRPTPLTPVQAAERDRWQGLLDQCLPGLTSDALSWMFAPQAKEAEPAAVVPTAYSDWFDAAERKAIRASALLPTSTRANSADMTKLLDYSLAALAMGQPLSRVGGDAMSQQFRRAASKGVWDNLLTALNDGKLDNLSESRRAAIKRVAQMGCKVRKQVHDKERLRRVASDQMAKSRRRAKTA